MSEILETEVLISGGGFAGLALGIALTQAGIGVIVAEAAPPAEAGMAVFDGRVSSIAPDVKTMMGALGIWQSVAEVQPVTDIVVSGGTAGGAASPFFLHFDAADAGRTLFDIVENRFLRDALTRRAAACGLKILAPVRIAEAQARSSGIEAILADGRSVRARLLVAAEGRDSPLRDMFAIKSSGWDYGQWGIVCTVEHERPHGGIAQEYFLPSGPFAILPMTGNRASLVWAERTDLAKALLDLDEEDFAAEMSRRFTGYLGAVRPAGARWGYPLTTRLARSYIAPRFALIGDAAHVIHPLAGQGLNLGLRDAAALAEAVVDAVRLGLDAGANAPLEAYQRARRIDATAMAAVTDGLNRLFSNDIAPVRAVREAGLGIVNAIAPLRRLLATAAAGSGLGTAPRLLRGEVL